MKKNISARIVPETHLGLLSHMEVEQLQQASNSEIHRIFRQCSLAVLSAGGEIDDSKELLDKYSSFDIRVVQQDRGIKLEVQEAPP
ncbi:MAG: DUF4478 family protein, partial [Okeania sp. SIO1H5]|uniref:pyrimidine/purine nucleosidase domain-containing protein n=1 Tax=Okeania sp. SIO1H5 TaxID=2607777 RepID=UPI0013B9A0A0